MCHNNDNYIFDKVGIMLHGRNNFSSKLVKVIKHGRGHVYRSLHWLVQSLQSKKISLGAVVTEDKNRAARHLKKCAAEQKIPVVPASWIIRSLFERKLLPVDDQNHHLSPSPPIEVPSCSAQQEWSQEI
uniref:BRCT domain-containing protein n=2 Tax=Opuntia streptacantha TaxID=393608 RepID=A0A7C9FIS0_OPUST